MENERGFAWLDEGVEHTDDEKARARALAKRWSMLHNRQEQEGFRRASDFEDGRCCDYDPDPCETCGGSGEIGLSFRGRGRYDKGGNQVLFGIRCTNASCEDGYDVGPLREAEEGQRQRDADLQLEIDVVEEMLARIGARMMRPYEHWNEDEAYFQYMEEGRFGDYSR